MTFGIFCEHRLPRSWSEGDEHRLLHEALDADAAEVTLSDPARRASKTPATS